MVNKQYIALYLIQNRRKFFFAKVDKFLNKTTFIINQMLRCNNLKYRNYFLKKYNLIQLKNLK